MRIDRLALGAHTARRRHKLIMTRPALRSIPAVEKVLQALGETGLPRPVVLARVRAALGALRKLPQIPKPDAVLDDLRRSLAALRHTRIQPVINATGILIHTNLGRAPLAAAAKDALLACAGYSNLEFDLAAGERGPRAAYLENNLALLCGAEAATVVNNCAAALVLILRHFAQSPRDEVIISRGELVQIGGGFRIPDILEASGARLREVGTTNKTTVADYARALGPKTALLLKVHRSNFFMGGFVESPSTEDLAALAKKKRVAFVEDLGSGAVIATERRSDAEHEPTPSEVLKGGVDLVCCSGDKLFGGPQAGLIAGRARFISALKREPFFRALRCDKLVLCALQATVDLYLAGAGESSIPAWQMLTIDRETLRQRADLLCTALQGLPVTIRIGKSRGQVGGGTLPRSALESVALELSGGALAPVVLSARLRHGTPPVIGFVSAGVVKLDLRTVFPEQDVLLAQRLREACENIPST